MYTKMEVNKLEKIHQSLLSGSFVEMLNLKTEIVSMFPSKFVKYIDV